MSQLPQALLLTLFPCLLIVAALRDLVSFTIPNWISIAILAGFTPAALSVGLGWDAIGLHFAVGLACFVAALIMFALNWIGGGDAKLFAVAGLWLGWPASAEFVMVTAMAGGALAMTLLAVRNDWVRSHVGSIAPAWAMRLMEHGGPAPYGVAIALGGLFAFPASDLIGSLRRLF